MELFSVTIGIVCYGCFSFFFSSRRRHTRCLSDWSSDVCSSDLIGWWERRAERRLRDGNFKLGLLEARAFDVYNRVEKKLFPRVDLSRSWVDPGHRSEERRVGKESRAGWGRCQWRETSQQRRATW